MSLEKILMPGLGESVHEATISEWLVKVGDKVEKYDELAEAVSDKVTTAIPSQYSGVVKEFLVELDTLVKIGTPILAIEVEDAGGATPPPQEEKVAEAAKPAETTAKPIVNDKVKRDKRFSPAIIQLANEKGVDLNLVQGTGANGRITRKDVLAYLESGQSGASPVLETKPEPVAAASTSPQVEKPAVKVEEAKVEGLKEPAAKVSSAPVSPAKGVASEVVDASPIRKAIAKKMVQSATEIPHAWMMVEADVSNVVQMRNSIKDSFKKQEGCSITYFAFFMKAVVSALKKYPVLNSSWQDGKIIYYKDFNISIAVAVEDQLFVPVIKHADQLSITGIAKEINRLASLARSGQLQASDMQGGTFTLNSTGSFGSVQSMGIINHPQAAILQVESIRKQLVPVEQDTFKVCDMVNLCLSIDHRILDGLQAGRFLKEVKANLAKLTLDML